MNDCFCERLKPYGLRCRNCYRRDNDPPPLKPSLLRNPGSEAIITEKSGGRQVSYHFRKGMKVQEE